MTKYNDPFYFAVPRYGTTTPIDGRDHIRRHFGIDGEVEVVREELAFTLCRISGHEAAR